uniref:Thiopurine S-methyltransferase n=1 Tax=Cryptomonas curvata TaxID=233186 RepID=A0A7S0M278_9CRYP|mmetsp:Transcript_21072/g.44255  ORF Transcript_21072/g.44255 Transcript_21072/m.44255 type:complete len:114 (+) Transcript_21072:2-343(+)
MRPDVAGTFEACWDRGSFVAIDPARRPEYVAAVSALLDRGARILLVAVEHPPFGDGKLGPPYSATEEEIAALYGRDFAVQLLEWEDQMAVDPVWAKRGCGSFQQSVYLLTKRG